MRLLRDCLTMIMIMIMMKSMEWWMAGWGGTATKGRSAWLSLELSGCRCTKPVCLSAFHLVLSCLAFRNGPLNDFASNHTNSSSREVGYRLQYSGLLVLAGGGSSWNLGMPLVSREHGWGLVVGLGWETLFEKEVSSRRHNHSIPAGMRTPGVRTCTTCSRLRFAPSQACYITIVPLRLVSQELGMLALSSGG